MIQLTIIFKNSNVTLPLNFKNYKNADEHRKNLGSAIEAPIAGIQRIEDDYGTTAELDSGDIAGVVLVDLHREFDRQGEYSVMQTLSQKRAQESFQASAGSKILKPVNTLANSVN